MIGVDPSRAMLDVARRRPGGGLVRWIEGDAGAIDVAGADLVIMTGHVAQVILGDTEWMATLRAAHGALGVGGHLAFESRDPRKKSWAGGKAYAHPRRFEGPGVPPFVMWQEGVEIAGDVVQFQLHYQLDGEDLISENALRFRSKEELAETLGAAGFSVENIWGDWDRGPVVNDTVELIHLAARL
jgi:hypothetical protein